MVICLLGRSLACLLALFGLLSLLILICFAWLICEARSVNLLALVWLELARLVLYSGYLLACPLTLLCLLCVRCLVCLAWADCAWLTRTRSSLFSLGRTLLSLFSLGRLCLVCSLAKLALLAWTQLDLPWCSFVRFSLLGLRNHISFYQAKLKL